MLQMITKNTDNLKVGGIYMRCVWLYKFGNIKMDI